MSLPLFTNKNNSTRAFTLVELIVSISLMIIILTTVVFNQSDYSSGTVLRNIASDISLSLRQAQVYGISVKEFSVDSSDFNSAYGVEFKNTEEGLNSYILYGDRGSKNGIYDGDWSCPTGGTSECVQKVVLPPGYTIGDICLIKNNNSEACPMSLASITFKRPSTNALIKIFSPGGGEPAISNTKGVRIEIHSNKGEELSVIIYKTGQISIR